MRHMRQLDMWVIRAAAVFSALLLVGLASTVGARPLAAVQASGSLRVAVYRDFLPFVEGPRENLRGLDVDLAAAIAKRLGVKVEYMVVTAGDDVDADLRNAIWRGPVVGGAVADLMLHVPVDPRLASRNDKVVIFAPYYVERIAVVTDPAQTGGDTLLDAFGNHKVAVEGDSLVRLVPHERIRRPVARQCRTLPLGRGGRGGHAARRGCRRDGPTQ